MSDDASPADAGENEARMELESDALHESDSGYYLDCPECGSSVTVHRIVEDGRCSGTLDADVAEVEGDDEELQDPNCTAKLSLELIWEP